MIFEKYIFVILGFPKCSRHIKLVLNFEFDIFICTLFVLQYLTTMLVGLLFSYYIQAAMSVLCLSSITVPMFY